MFYILDWSGFLFRAYYSLPKIVDKNNSESWAIFGFFRMLLKLLQSRPNNLIIVFDPGTRTKRQEEFKDYKKNRPQIEDEFKQQIPKIIDILKRSNFDVEIVPEYEADDVIWSLVNVIKKYDKVVVVSSDKDLKQLIDDNVNFLEPKKMEYIDKVKFYQEKGFYPSALLLYLALLWDSSDNIPWVKWIWKKTAAEIVSKYPTVELLFQNLDSLPWKVKENLLKNKDLLERNIFLIKLKAIDWFDFQKLKAKSDIKAINFDLLKNILINEYGFKSFDKIISKIKKELTSPTQLGLF